MLATCRHTNMQSTSSPRTPLLHVSKRFHTQKQFPRYRASSHTKRFKKKFSMTQSLMDTLIHKFVNEPLPLPYEQFPFLDKTRNYILNFTFEKDDPFRLSEFYPTTLIPLVFYLGTTFALKHLFKGRPLDFRSNPILYAFGLVHNVILSLGSLIMFTGMFYGFLQVALSNYLLTQQASAVDSFLVGICDSKGSYWNNNFGTAFWIWVFMVRYVFALHPCI